MTLSITAYRFNREPHNWCGGVIQDGYKPVADSARMGLGFKTRAEALAWARDEKAKLTKMEATGKARY